MPIQKKNPCCDEPVTIPVVQVVVLAAVAGVVGKVGGGFESSLETQTCPVQRNSLLDVLQNEDAHKKAQLQTMKEIHEAIQKTARSSHDLALKELIARSSHSP